MKFLVTVEANKKVPDHSPYSFDKKKDVEPMKHELYMAIQEYLGANGYDVSELSVKEDATN